MADTTTETNQKLTKNANRVIRFVLISILLSAIYSSISYFLGQADVINVALTWIIAIVSGIAFGVSRRGKATLGVLMIMGIIWLAILAAPFRNAEIGFVLGIFAILLTLAVVPQTLAPKPALWAIGAGTVIGLLTLLVDWYWPIKRPVVPGSVLSIVYIFGFGLIIVNGFFLLRQIREYSLRAKLTIAFLTVAVLSVSIVGVTTSIVARTNTISQVGKNIDTLANTVAQQVGDDLNSQLEILQVVATRFDQIAESASRQYSGTPEEIQIELLERDAQWRGASGTDQIILDVVNNSTSGILREIRRNIPSHLEIFLTDSHGANIAATNRTTDYYQADEEWWQVAYNNGEGSYYISRPIYDESTQRFAIEFAVPVFANGKLAGILRSTYEAKVLTDILKNLELGGSGQADIRVADDLLLGLEAVDLQVINQETQAELDRLTGGFKQIFLEGEEVIASQALLALHDTDDSHDQVVRNLNWSVIVHQDVVIAFAPIEASTRTITLVSIAFILLTGLLASYISTNLSNPIVRLTAVAEEVRTGNLEVQAEVTSQDEIGTLASTFNGMTNQIRTLVGTLEQRVVARTQALETSTEVSRRLSTILNRNELVREVVEQVQQAFNYYHVHIYLWDDKQENLIMVGGTGEAGRLMLASGHSIPAERGLVGRAAETGRVVLVPDVSKTIGWVANPLLPETKSEIAVPIAQGENVLGVLDVQDDEVNRLTQADADLLLSIANQVAVALQNIKSTEIVTKRATEFQTVAKISTVAATISDVQKMLESVVHLTQRGFDLYHAHVFVYNENTTELQIVACGWKEGDEHEGTHGTASIPLQQEQSLVARAARTRQAVIVNDVHSDPGWLPNPLLPETASEMAVPMIVGDQLLGVLDVQSERLNAFTEEDASIQTTLASQVATALQNARSFHLAQEQAERETVVNLITQKIQSATSIEAALQVAARELGHALGMKQTLVTLDLDSNGGRNGNPTYSGEQKNN